MKRKNNNLNVFKGENSVLDFLNPGKNLFTPLVEVPSSINPFYKNGVRIYAKLLSLTPLMNVKSYPAFNMLDKLNKKGKLKNVNTIVENSSGNTVLSLAVIARQLGIDRTMAFVSNEVIASKLLLLQLFGVECHVNKESICPDPSDKNSGIYKADKLGKKDGFLNPGQYKNLDNPLAHEKWTAPQIFEQLDGDIQIFSAGLGTTGTLVGNSKYLKRRIKNINIIGAIRKPNNPIPGVRTRSLLKMIAFDWQKHIDEIVEVSSKDSYEMSLQLIRNGIVAGPSSGFAYKGLIDYISGLKKNIEKLRNKKGLINAVFICPDSPFFYMKEYFEYLDESFFPKVINKDLLIDRPNEIQKIKIKSFEISPDKLVKTCYSKDFMKKENFEIIDLRTKAEFEHFHLFDSINIEYENFHKKILRKVSSFSDKKIILVCSLGLKSSEKCNFLRDKGVLAYSLTGGLVEWSRLNLPRWKPHVCLKKGCGN